MVSARLYCRRFEGDPDLDPTALDALVRWLLISALPVPPLGRGIGMAHSINLLNCGPFFVLDGSKQLKVSSGALR